MMREESFEGLSHARVLATPALAVIFCFRFLHHRENVLYRCIESIRHWAIQGDP
jgi:hypothetical protein